MKKLISLLLVAAMCTLCLSACGKKDKASDPDTDASGGLAKTLQETEASEGYVVVDEDFSTDDLVPSEETEAGSAIVTRPAEEAQSESQNHTVGNVMPFATEAPQPNTAITSFYEVSNTGLGFKYNYPANWTNLPGRNTVCFVQPMGNGTIYPGRVAVTMKKLSHSCGQQDLQLELVSFLKNLMNLLDRNTFKVDSELDTETKFMGKDAISTTYLGYDGSREVKGYVIATHFERYVFVFHFLCAYGDYDAFWPSICKMRDSVQVEKED